MKRLILILAALACISAQAQNLKKTFTGTAQGFTGIPTYQEGKDFYVNPYPGGQSGDLFRGESERQMAEVFGGGGCCAR